MAESLSDLGFVPQADDLSGLGFVPEVAPVAAEPEPPTLEEIEAQRKAAQAEEDRKTFIERYGPSVAAGLESYGRTVLPLAYQKYEELMGVPREEQKRRAEEHPVAAGLGMVGGIIGGVALTGGLAPAAEAAGATAATAAAASGAGRLAQAAAAAKAAGTVSAGVESVATPLALAARAGSAVRAGVTALAPESALVKTAAGALAAGTEGTLVSGFIEADEANLKDRQISGEAIMHGALLSSGIGGVLSGVPAALQTIGKSNTGKRWASKLGTTLASQIMKSLGVTPRDIEVARGQIGPEGLVSVMNDAADYGIASPHMSLDKMLAKAKDLKSKAGKIIGDFAKEADARLTPDLAPKIDDIAERVSDDVVAKYEKFVNRPVAQEIAGWVSDLKNRFRNGMTVSDLAELRTELGGKVFGADGQRIPANSPLAQAYRDVGGILTKELRDVFDRAGIDEQAWRIPQRQYHVASKVADYAQDAVDALTAKREADAAAVLPTMIGYAFKGIPGAIGGYISKGILKATPEQFGKATGWVAGALKNALESGAPKAVVNDLKAFQALREREILSNIPGAALTDPDVARLEHLRLMTTLDQARQLMRAEPDKFIAAGRSYYDAVEQAHDVLRRSYSPNMSPAFAARQVQAAENILTPASRLTRKSLGAYQGEAASLVRAARDELRQSLARSDAWGQAYRDAAAQRIYDTAAKMSDPRRTVALQSLEDATRSLTRKSATKADEFMQLSKKAATTYAQPTGRMIVEVTDGVVRRRPAKEVEDEMAAARQRAVAEGL